MATKCSKANCQENCKTCPKQFVELENENDFEEVNFIELAIAPKKLKLNFHENAEWYKVQTIFEIMQVFDLILEKTYILLAGNTAQGKCYTSFLNKKKLLLKVKIKTIVSF